MDELAKRKIPSKVALDYPVEGAQSISEEAEGLVKKFGETMEFYQLKYTKRGIQHGLWTCLGLKAKKGDMCDDSTGKFNYTQAWREAPLIRKLLDPIGFALRRVRLSIMHPATMVSWHCDNCPRKDLSPRGCPGHVDPKRVRKTWKNKFHEWVRLHLMLSTNDDVEFGIGGMNVQGTQNGGFYLANVAMPHRVDNKGSSTRTALLVDVSIKGFKKGLKKTELGRSVLKAWRTVIDAKGADTYLEMGHSLYRYLCGLNAMDRYETEWHSRAYWNGRPLWRPLPPFQAQMFNTPGRCGIYGPQQNKKRIEAKWALMEGEKPGFPELKDAPLLAEMGRARSGSRRRRCSKKSAGRACEGQ